MTSPDERFRRNPRCREWFRRTSPIRVCAVRPSSNLPDNLRGVAQHGGSGGHVARDHRARLDKRPLADAHAFEDCRAGADPDGVFDDYRLALDLRPRTPVTQSRTGDRVGDSLGRLYRMKIT